MNISAEHARTITAQNSTIEALIRKAAAQGNTSIIVSSLRKEQEEELTALGFHVSDASGPMDGEEYISISWRNL